MEGGVYLVIFHLAGSETIRIGRMGRFEFPAGHYAYVGSAQRNMEARVARHARRRKPLRWHIDYLAKRAEFQGAMMLFGARKSLECELAELVAKQHARWAPGFGASDCRCGGHLFHIAVASRPPR